MYPPVRISAPAVVPVSVAEAKTWLHVDHTDEDALIGALIDAAVSYLDGFAGVLGRCMVEQSWQIKTDCLEKRMRLPLAPVSAITSIKVTDSADVQTTISSTNYDLMSDAISSFVRFKDAYGLASSLSEVQAIEITFVAGYGTAATDVPQALVQAIKMMVAYWYANRETGIASGMAEIPIGASALIAPFIRRGLT